MAKKILEVFNKYTECMGDTIFGHWTPRMVVAGIDMSDVLRIRAQKPDWSDWPALWEKLGDEHLKRGDDSLAAAHTVTAGQA